MRLRDTASTSRKLHVRCHGFSALSLLFIASSAQYLAHASFPIGEDAGDMGPDIPGVGRGPPIKLRLRLGNVKVISRYALCIIGFVFSATLDTASAQQGSVNVVTYHSDNLRTGWNPNETVLTTSNVNSSTFGVLAQVTLDDQVDAQPLIVNNTVYVVTENNTVYAIDGGTGAILNSNNLGPPVQRSALPGRCKENGADVGIQSTPVIDVAAGVMYVVTYTWESNLPVFRIHQRALSNLAEINNSVIASSHILSDGQTVFAFNARYQRQRSALLEANGNVYTAFSSFCRGHDHE